MNNREAKDVLNAAVGEWHKIAEDHGIEHCNCFRVAFGERLMEEFDVPLWGDDRKTEEMDE